jgi:hypothetical protein
MMKTGVIKYKTYNGRTFTRRVFNLKNLHKQQRKIACQTKS